MISSSRCLDGVVFFVLQVRTNSVPDVSDTHAQLHLLSTAWRRFQKKKQTQTWRVLSTEPRGGERIWGVTASMLESQSAVQIGGNHLPQPGRGPYTMQLCPVGKKKGVISPTLYPQGYLWMRPAIFAVGEDGGKNHQETVHSLFPAPRLWNTGLLGVRHSAVTRNTQETLWTRTLCLSFFRTGITEQLGLF